MTRRVDLFAECNTGHHPIDLFIRECCASCFNPECTRSLAGKMRFDRKVAEWFPRYFEAPRMPPDDPRFGAIAAQQFIMIDPGRTPEASSAWIDPLNPSESPASAVLSPAPPPPPPELAPVLPMAGELSGKKVVAAHLLLANAPLQPATIPRPPSSPTVAPSPPKDAWAAPQAPATSNLPIVAPGSRVKVGGVPV